MEQNTYVDEGHLARHYATVDDFAARSRSWETLAKGSISAWYVDGLADCAFREVLDAGCGPGRFSAALARARPVNITAIDIAAEMVDAARAAVGDAPGHHEFVRSSIEQAPFGAGRFDLALANLVLHHVPDIAASFERLAGFVRPGGHLALLVADFDWMSELNRFQDEALLRLGLAYDDAALAPPGTNRFCDANIGHFVPRGLTLRASRWFDGTMTFPDVDALLDFYVRTFRHKNVAARFEDGALRRAVRQVVEARAARTGSLAVSSSVFQYVFRKG